MTASAWTDELDAEARQTLRLKVRFESVATTIAGDVHADDMAIRQVNGVISTFERLLTAALGEIDRLRASELLAAMEDKS